MSQQALILLALPFTLALAFLGVLARLQAENTEAQNWAAHSQEVMAQAHGALTDLTSALAGLRGSVVAADTSFAEAAEQAGRDLSEGLGRLNDLVRDNPEQSRRTEALAARASEFLAWQAELLTLVRAGDLRHVAERVRARQGQALADAFRGEMSRFLAEEQRLDRERADTLRRSRQGLNVVLATGAAVALLGTAGLAWVFRRGVGGRFAALVENTRRLAEGKELAPPPGGTDEIAQLDSAFRAMAAQIRASSERLRDSARQVRDLYDEAPCGYHSVNADGTVTFMNRTELRWLGYEEDEVVGRLTLADLMTPDSARRYREALARFKESGSARDLEFDIVRRDGTILPVLINSTLLRDADGNYAASRSTVLDLTQRRRAEQAARLYADVVRHVPVGLTIWRLADHGDARSLQLVAANPAACRLHGVDLSESAGRTMLELFPAVPESDLAAYADVVRSGQARDFGEVYYGDERVQAQYWDVKGFPLPDDCVGLAFENASERRRSEEALRQSAERFRMLAESAVDYGLLALDPKGRVVSWNAGAERIKGYREAEILGRHFSCFYPTEAVERGWPDHELKVAGEQGRFEDEGWRVRKDGSRFWANVVITALRNKAGQLEGFSKLTRDLTERKQTEDMVRRLNEELEERVQSRTAELAEANRELTHKNSENEMFVYSVSHDLRSPLVNLQGFSRELDKGCQALAALLADDAVPPTVRTQAQALLSGKMAKGLGFIQAAVLRLSNIIDALLRLSRAGRVDYQWQRVDVAGLVRRVLAAANGTIQERGVQVTTGDLPPAWGDSTALEQVFGNLVGNALTYGDPGRPGVIEVGCLLGPQPGVADGFSVYYVRDNGLGIAEAHRQKIFQVFQRAHPGVGKGEGLGLAIVARVVERHRGRVWVESRVGEGSTFFVSLPSAPGANGAAGGHAGPGKG